MDPVIAAAAITAGADAVGSASSGIFKPSLKKQWKYAQKQMALQQQYAIAQMKEQAKLNYENWQKQFDYENDFNDPSKVFERYRKAGVTPAGVLGASGVGVNATMSPTPASASGASGPSGVPFDFSNPVGNLGSSMASGAQVGIDAVRSGAEVDALNAKGERDRAEARWYEGETHSVDYRSAMDALDLAFKDAGVQDANVQLEMHRIQRDILDREDEFQATTFGYRLESFIAEVGILQEKYNNMKQFNVKYFDKLLSSEIALNNARALEAVASKDLAVTQEKLAQVTLQDAEKWFDLNWNAEIEVPEIDDKGKPTGKTFTLKGQDIQESLMGLRAAGANQEVYNNWFHSRQVKNAFGYQIVDTFLNGAIQIGSAAVAKPGYTPTIERRETYNAQGRAVGGTKVTKQMLK